MIALLVPVKDFQNSKSRLSGLLSPGERAGLARAMFEDVAESIFRSPEVAEGRGVRVVLLSNSGPAIELAASFGWEIIHEEEQSSENASVDRASKLLAARGFSGALRLPADIPLLTAEDVEKLILLAGNSMPVLLVPSHDGTGTNAILRCPPDLFPSRFGPRSLIRHQEEARLAGVAAQIVHFPHIAMDVDEPADLKRVIQGERDNRTCRLLRYWGIEERLNAKQR